MNKELYNLYGNYTPKGNWISDHEKYHYFVTHPKEMRNKKIIAWMFILIPIAGIIFTSELYDEMGISIF